MTHRKGEPPGKGSQGLGLDVVSHEQKGHVKEMITNRGELLFYAFSVE